jgi:hypothetical protein
MVEMPLLIYETTVPPPVIDERTTVGSPCKAAG